MAAHFLLKACQAAAKSKPSLYTLVFVPTCISQGVIAVGRTHALQALSQWVKLFCLKFARSRTQSCQIRSTILPNAAEEVTTATQTTGPAASEVSWSLSCPYLSHASSRRLLLPCCSVAAQHAPPARLGSPRAAGGIAGLQVCHADGQAPRMCPSLRKGVVL